MKNGDLEFRYCPGLMISYLNPCMQRRNKAGLCLVLAGPCSQRPLLGSCVSWSRGTCPAPAGVRVGTTTPSFFNTEYWAKTPLETQSLQWFPLLLRTG